MVKILQFPQTKACQNPSDRHGRLLETFSQQRRESEDVFWLKENAELLNILECTKTSKSALPALGDPRLEALTAFYDGAARHLCFFRQYYRFILSICMDLEDLGLVAASHSRPAPLEAEAMAHWVLRQGLPDHELSDLQRAEARRLLARRGVACDFDGLDERLHQFIDGAENFAMPNRKAAYELTHILFYLSDYGRRDPRVSRRAVQSLTYVGLLAFLDRDADLLAEVCIALRYAGEVPAPTWEHWLEWHTRSFTLMTDMDVQSPHLQQDDYHMYFVCNWHQALLGQEGFAQRVPEGRLRVKRPAPKGILGALSQAVFSVDATAGGWRAVRPHIAAALSEEENRHLTAAEQSCQDFDRFFHGFARLGAIAPAPFREARA